MSFAHMRLPTHSKKSDLLRLHPGFKIKLTALQIMAEYHAPFEDKRAKPIL
jgi:hypothetical protein